MRPRLAAPSQVLPTIASPAPLIREQLTQGGQRMIHEIITQHVAPDRRDEYIQVFGDILKKANYPGSHAIKFFTSIEDPSLVILMIEWDSVEAHTQHRGTPTHN